MLLSDVTIQYLQSETLKKCLQRSPVYEKLQAYRLQPSVLKNELFHFYLQAHRPRLSLLRSGLFDFDNYYILVNRLFWDVSI